MRYDDYVTKPVNPDLLLEKINAYLRLKEEV
jgi:DNA-binding response OmpR family regulator